jgi:hypothetical protein
MKLQNTVMQLRKVCSHPFLFDWPVDERTRQPVINEDLVHASGKMMMLERLLDELFARGHKVLLFSQFTMMLDIIEVRAPSQFTCPPPYIFDRTGQQNSRVGDYAESTDRHLPQTGQNKLPSSRTLQRARKIHLGYSYSAPAREVWASTSSRRIP